MKNHKLYILCALCAFGGACADEPTKMNQPDMGGDLTSPVDQTKDMPDEGTDLPDETPDVLPDLESDETPDACVPDACPDSFCGEMSDGCGGTLMCGQTPETCASQGPGACGVYEDGCGSQIDCAACLCDVRGGAPEVPLEPTCGPCGLGRTTCTVDGVPGCALPEFPGAESFWAGLEGQCQDIMFVDAIDGVTGAPGTRDQPLASLEVALTQARPLIVVRGQRIELLDTLDIKTSLVGGFAQGFIYDPDRRTELKVTTPAGAAIGARAQNIVAPTLVANFDILGPSAPSGEDAIGLLASGAKALHLSNVRILAGDAGAGNAGSAGSSGADGVDGGAGAPGYAYSNTWTFSTCAQIPQCNTQPQGRGAFNPACSTGTRGGDGGHGGFAEVVLGASGSSSEGGVSGGPSGPIVGAQGTRATGFAMAGMPGAGGIAGLGRFNISRGWSPHAGAQGRAGGEGDHGAGGGGGGGGPIGPTNQSGPSGSGGGSGGCGGSGATGGTSGRASIGLAALSSTGMTLTNTTIKSSRGGEGGRGAFGGAGGAGPVPPSAEEGAGTGGGR